MAEMHPASSAPAQAHERDPAAPTHVAIIMDGNGRWAKGRHLPRVAGHQQGAEAVRRTVRACCDMGVRYLTLFAFSSENWKRPAQEVDDLMWLLRRYLKKELGELHRQGIRVRFIGDRSALAPDLIDMISDAETRTRANEAMDFIVAVNYGGQNEIVRAARALVREAAEGRIGPDDVNAERFAAHLYTAGIPDPDLVIRTSGEQRLSNFLLWQAAYAELVFVDTFWPDFNEETLREAVRVFQQRERRYGGTTG